MSSKLDGVADLTAKLNEFGAKMAARELRATVGNALKIAEHAARASIPVGELPHFTYRGRLVSGGYAVSTLHIETKINKKTGTATAALGVGREAFYAVQFVELGTSKMPARPWLRPAFESSEDPMLQAIGTELRARIDKIAAKRARAAR